MNNTIAKFGYNTDTYMEGYTASEKEGSKKTFTNEGIVLGVFSSNDKNYLLSLVTSSFARNCLKGTVDVREITIESEANSSYILISNNEISVECVDIAKELSESYTEEDFNSGKQIEESTGFELLEKKGIQLTRQNFEFEDEIHVCGIEPEKFETFKKASLGKAK